MKSKSSVSVPLAVAVLAAACGASPAFAAGASGMTVTRDAETGQLRAPTAAEMKALEAAGKASAGNTGRAAAPAVQIKHANGAVEMALGEDTVMYSVARINAEGKLERVCVQGVDAGLRALKGPVSFATMPQASRVAHAAPIAKSNQGPIDEK